MTPAERAAIAKLMGWEVCPAAIPPCWASDDYSVHWPAQDWRTAGAVIEKMGKHRLWLRRIVGYWLFRDEDASNVGECAITASGGEPLAILTAAARALLAEKGAGK